MTELTRAVVATTGEDSFQLVPINKVTARRRYRLKATSFNADSVWAMAHWLALRLGLPTEQRPRGPLSSLHQYHARSHCSSEICARQPQIDTCFTKYGLRWKDVNSRSMLVTSVHPGTTCAAEVDKRSEPSSHAVIMPLLWSLVHFHWQVKTYLFRSKRIKGSK